MTDAYHITRAQQDANVLRQGLAQIAYNEALARSRDRKIIGPIITPSPMHPEEIGTCASCGCDIHEHANAWDHGPHEVICTECHDAQVLADYA